ncbi:gamma-glutamylcyclotransferase family protein [Reichenbachiella ulvae]|uniref:Gamma-glutamylcyclotransferase n=1 Tax=Reichenbachiella ulvae TaxID=2980104 RepID=A0ABT3CPE6_9BACT|nr:gamma-glutamylcyclotransferase family protein [Reichenbachiella ulvae]MCV9385153.1 gamma-glutamylcyclotransferase [Reichenbachiella ulvae]
MNRKLFVYGTLMSPYDNPFAKKLHGMSQVLGEASFKGRLYRIKFYPGLLHSNDENDRIYGELLQINGDIEDLFVTLDEYEGANTGSPEGDHYSRELVEVELDGQKVECWTYIYLKPVDEAKRIESGRFEG